MIGTGIDVRVKLQDIVASQLPEYVRSDSPLTADFLKQFMVSQEFQSGAVDFAANLDQYLDVNILSASSVYGKYQLTQDVGPTDDVIYVDTTKSFPNQWGLLKVDDEIITYTGITTNSFTGAIRGFSGITEYHDPRDPRKLVFETTTGAAHKADASVENLSTKFLQEFFRKVKFTFAPGLEELEFFSEVNIGNVIKNARSFYQTKGSEESIRILFKALYGQEPTVIDLERFLIKASQAEYSRRDYAVAIPVEGNPVLMSGKTLFQSNSSDVFGSVSEIEPFTRDQRIYYKLFFYVASDEIGEERKLFTTPGRTQAQRNWNPGDKTLTVDSTIGFRDNGEFITSDGTKFTYELKTVNQFLGVESEDPTKTISVSDEIIDDITVVGNDINGDPVVMRLTGSISDIDFSEAGIPFTTVGEKIRVDTLGQNIKSSIATRNSQTYPEIVANSFIYNTSVRFEVFDFVGSTFTLAVPYLDKSSLNVGDSVDILNRNSNQILLGDRLVTNVDFVNSTITINDSTGLIQTDLLDIRRRQKYANSINTPIDWGNNNILSNVLNLYDATEYDNNFYVATNSLPSYDIDAAIIESTISGFSTANVEDFNSFENEYATIVFDSTVDFITGDLITYSVKPGVGSTEVFPVCAQGEYIVEVLSDRRKIRLYLSPSFIGSSNYVGFVPNNEPGTHIFTLEIQKTRTINTQRAYRKIPISENGTQNIAVERTPAETPAGVIALLTNGVSIYSYRSPSKVYLGPIVEIDPVSSGRGYDAITPPEILIDEPNLQITDPNPPPNNIPRQAKATPVIKGKLEKILIDPQDFDIDQIFSITVTGGNSLGASAQPQIERRNRSIPFDTRIDTFGGGINPNEETIQFLIDHNLAKGTPIVYNNRGFFSIGVSAPGGTNNGSQSLSNGGVYYAEPVNNRTIKLYPNVDDLYAGINTVGLTSNFTGFGIQAFDTLSRNRLTAAIITEDGGDFYYRKMHFGPENVFTEYDEIRYNNHGFNTGDIVEYGTESVSPTGLATAISYYVVAPDENTIKLCDAGIGGTSKFDYDRLAYVNFETTGVGTQFIKYPDIKVDVKVSYSSTITGTIVATPFVRGEIEQVYVDNGGYYGSDIINFQKNPDIKVQKGEGARVKPLVVNGEILAIQILNKGRLYPDTPDLVIEDTSGSGRGAVVRAIVIDGEIEDVVIINRGVSYNEETTDITVVDPSKDAILTPRIRPLTVNLNARFGFEGLVDNNYSVVSYDRKIREGVYADFGFSHSPIIGWANDGNPIYGGFGLSDAEDINSGFRAMNTAYDLAPSNVEGRPSLAKYPSGFFIDDYAYTDNGDLDEFNGRYCRTPEFPNGVYAYFAGISTDTQSSAREPQFPYFIGPKYRDAPQDDSTGDVNQDFNINDKPFFRNTFPYYVGSPRGGSEFIDQSYLFDVQDSIIESTLSGKADQIEVVGIGQSYKVGDVPVFESDEDYLSSRISAITGKEIREITSNTLGYPKEAVTITELNADTLRVFVEPSHEFSDGDSVIFSGLSTNTARLAGPQQIKFTTTQMSLFSPIPPQTFGEVRDIFVNSISEEVSVGCTLYVGVGSTGETQSVINIFPEQKALRVVRPGPSYPFTNIIGAPVEVSANYFDIDNDLQVGNITSQRQLSYYFNPKQTVGLGVVSGATHTTEFKVGDTIKRLSIPVQRIYAPQHGFRTNEPVEITMSSNAQPINVFDEQSNISGSFPDIITRTATLYAVNKGKNHLGLRTDPNGGDLYFSTNGSDDFLYNIKTKRHTETATLDRISGIVETQEPHLLQNNDLVNITLKAFTESGVGNNDTVVVKFDEISQSLIIDPQTADQFDVDISQNIITIDAHGYVLGDYLLYENYETPIAGLETHQKYYAIPFDQNRFLLAETFADITPGKELVINLESTGIGTHIFSKVNPQIRIVNNNNISFDVSDPSLLNSELHFFYDPTQTEIFDNNGVDEVFVTSGFSTEGYPGARKYLNYSENNPEIIYYGLEIGGYISTSETRTISNNSITYIDSAYSRSSGATVIDDTTFSYSLLSAPEVAIYDKGDIEVSYTTNSQSSFGGVGIVEIISSGNNFTKIPEFITVESEFGFNASLRAKSNNIGRLSSFRIQQPGWGYSADNTLRPKGLVQPKVEFTDSDFIVAIDVVDGGSGYQQPPNGVLIDAVTREVVTSGAIELEVQSSTVSEVIIDVPPSGLSKNSHELYTINNSNGIPILLVQNINQNVGVVTFAIQTPIEGYFTEPFEVGDKVFVENIIAEVGQESRMNSSDYGYQFFNVIKVLDTNPIQVTVEYPEEARNNIGVAVTFQGAFSSMVNKKIYPTFAIQQDTAIFIEGERLSVIDSGVIQEVDLVVEESNTNFFKVRGNYDILVGERLKGNISGIILTVTGIAGDDCRFVVGSVSRISNGWLDDVGFLNEEFQVVPDNDYYQKLSYSIKSEVNFVDLIGPVNRLVHPAGMKNFSDTKIEGSGKIGVAASSTTSNTLDFIGLTDVADTPLRVDRINSFDLGYDNEVNNNRSNAIRFNSRTPNKRLTDYIEVRTNRVLLVDDISSQFIDADNIQDQKDYTEFFVINSEYTRGVLFVRNPFTDQAQLIEVISLTYNNNAFTLTKATVSDNDAGYGTFEAYSTLSTEYNYRFTPYDIENFDIDYKLLTNRFVFEDKPAADIGFARLDGGNFTIQSGENRGIFGALSAASDAAFINVQIQDFQGNYYYYEYYAVRVGSDTYGAVYGFDGTPLQNVSDGFVGEFEAFISNGRLRIRLRNTNPDLIVVTVKSTEFRTPSSGQNPFRFKRPSIVDGEERGINVGSTFTSGLGGDTQIEVFRLDSFLFQAARSVINVSGTSIGAIHQIMAVNSSGNAYLTAYPFLTQGSDLDPQAGIGSFGAILEGDDMVVYFYPDAGLNPGEVLDFTAYTESFYRELDTVNYRNIPLTYAESQERYYQERYLAPLGERTNNVRFPMEYEEVPIYEKVFNPPTTVSSTGPNNLNLFNIDDHFFSPQETLYYIAENSVPTRPASPIRVSIDGGPEQDMPDIVYCIKRDLNRFSLAATEQDAIDLNPMEIVGLGTGNAHRIGMTQKLEKTLITIDGVIQSPIAASNKFYSIGNPITVDDTLLSLNGIGTIRIGDLLLLEDEYIKIDNVGFSTSILGPINNTGNVPLIEVERGVVGSAATDHANGTAASLYRGSYNLVESDVIFTEAPSGKGALNINESNLVELNSSFQGRVFLQKEYDQITLFDDISDQFNGQLNTFTLTSDGSTQVGVNTLGEVENGSGVLIINDIYQTPTTDNNDGNNYFYTADANTGINSVTFTGITSANGERVESIFDVNQNQIPRGGLIVSLGSTPGLGYAPLFGASIEPILDSNGSIIGIQTTNRIGVGTDVKYADYNEQTGDLVITCYGAPKTGALPAASAQYLEVSGQMIVTTSATIESIGLEQGDIVVLDNFEFSCTSGAGTTTIFPDKNAAFVIVSIVDDNRFSVDVGVSTITHTYVSGGTFQSFEPMLFGADGLDPDFVYLQGLEFSCPGGETAGLTTTLFPQPGQEGIPVVFRDDIAHYRLQVGVSTIVHVYESGGTISEYAFNNPGSGYKETVNIDVDEDGHTGTPAVIEGVPGLGGELSFNIVNPGTGYTNPYISAPDPVYFNMPITGVYRRSVGFTTLTGRNLFVTVDIGAATTTAVGRSEFFEVSNYEITNQGYSFEAGDIVEVVGLVTDKSLSAPIEPFQLTVLDIFTDNFSAWNFGETDYIDSIRPLQDGFRTRFPLLYKGETFSFEQDLTNEDSAAVDLDSILLIYVNTVLQVPRVSYNFDGGTTFQFTRAPFPEDDIDIYFYRGKRNVDSIEVTEVDESIRPGDELQIRKNNYINKTEPANPTKTQDIRTVTEIASSDTVRTNIYFGNDDLETKRPREVAWDKQKRDIFIYGEPFSKARDSLEPIIAPTASILSGLTSTSTQILVDNSQLFKYEQTEGNQIIAGMRARIYSQPREDYRPAVVQAVVNGTGNVTSINIIDNGAGYNVSGPEQNTVAIASPVDGDRASARIIFNSFDGSIAAFIMLDQGSGYDQSNPPNVLISEPQLYYEDVLDIPTVLGYSGILTGISSPASGRLKFEFELDENPFGGGNSLEPGFRVVIGDTFVGPGAVRSLATGSFTNVVAIGASAFNNVYEVRSRNILGFRGEFVVDIDPSTNVGDLPISGDNLGNFSWGVLNQAVRDIDFAVAFPIQSSPQFDAEMKDFPTIIRRTQGLRNEGGLGKKI